MCSGTVSCSVTTDAQAFPVSLSRVGAITATLESVTPPPTTRPITLLIGTALSQPGGVHGCDVDDARYELDYMPVLGGGLILPGQVTTRLPGSVTRSGSSGGYCVVVQNFDRVAAHTVTLTITTVE